MKLTHLSFAVFIILEQFYMFDSGGLQLGDLFILISFVLCIYMNRGKITLTSIDCLLLYFLIGVMAINGLYFVIHQKYEFVLSTLHYIFNLLVVILFREYAKDVSFLELVYKACKLNLWIQLAVFISGLGRYYLGVRYMGTFNDPNQMAFFIFITMLILYLLSHTLGKSLNQIYYLIVGFLIFQTASTGMFIGLFSFMILLIISHLRLRSFLKNNMKKLLILNYSIIVVACVVLISPFNLKELFHDNYLLQRVEEKIAKAGFSNNPSSYSQMGLIEERGIDKLIVYPERIILGAGQGFYERFDQAAHTGEVHSTIPSVLFSYGIFPTVLLLLWFARNIGKPSQVTIIVFLPLLIESFTLLNQRQPLFWILFVSAHIYSYNRHTKDQNHTATANDQTLPQIVKYNGGV